MGSVVDTLPEWKIWIFVTCAFGAAYFCVSVTTTWLTGTVFPRLRLGRSIEARPLALAQIRREVIASAVSISIFGGYAAATMAAYRAGLIEVDFSHHMLRMLLDLLLLALWNEMHFYLCHRLLHTRWLFRHVHCDHHRSVTPSAYSAYSFHWFEALLLGSVMLTAMVWHTFNIFALALFPLVSLLLNNYGHMNYDLFPRASDWNPLTATRRHTLHHTAMRGNYGFALPLLDLLLGTAVRKQR
jgi:Delta7-sterol 5-desaturase